MEYSVEKYWELFGGLQNWRIIIVCKLSNKIKLNLKLNKQSEHLPRERVSRREESIGPRFRRGSTCSHWLNEVDWDKLVWDAAIMPKHAFIFWLAIQDRLSTFDRLVKWGWQGNLLCGFCRNKCESRDHIFFECSFSSRMWQQVVWECLLQQVPDHWGAVIDWGLYLTGRSIQSRVGKWP